MKFMNKMERKFGRYAIRNLTMYILVLYVAGIIVDLYSPETMELFLLQPGKILKGEVWRLVTWIFHSQSVEVSTWGILSTFIMISCTYFVGNTLERTIGAFRYNVYIFSGLLLNLIGAFILYFALGGSGVPVGIFFGSYYLMHSLFYTFTILYPDMTFMLYMIIPVKAKWIILLDVVLLGKTALDYWRFGWIFFAIFMFVLLLSFIPFIVFAISLASQRHKRTARQKDFQRKIKYGQKQEAEPVKEAVKKEAAPKKSSAITRHRCAVCGRTEQDDPNLTFRFCSKCAGNHEYCQDHLFTHQHVE